MTFGLPSGECKDGMVTLAAQGFPAQGLAQRAPVMAATIQVCGESHGT